MNVEKLLAEDLAAVERARALLRRKGMDPDEYGVPMINDRRWFGGREVWFRHETKRDLMVYVGWIREFFYEFGPSGLAPDAPERDVANTAAFLEADLQAEARLGFFGGGRGSNWTRWEHKKRFLKEKFGIDWRNPTEVNGVRID